jgi:hypothetical protein
MRRLFSYLGLISLNGGTPGFGVRITYFDSVSKHEDGINHNWNINFHVRVRSLGPGTLNNCIRQYFSQILIFCSKIVLMVFNGAILFKQSCV